MATNTLTDQNISDTYEGLVHGNGVQFPASGTTVTYDGAGNQLSIAFGRTGQGFAVTGNITASGDATFGNTLVSALTAGTLKYPVADGAAGAWLRTNGNKQLFFSNTIPASAFGALSPSPAGTYANPSSVIVNAAGQITALSAGSVNATNVSLFVTPILIYDVVSTSTGTSVVGPTNVSVANVNRPANSTHAILHIEAGVSDSRQGYNNSEVSVTVNGFRAVTAGYKYAVTFNGGNSTNTTRYDAAIASNNVSVQINRDISGLANLSNSVKIWLLGYGTFTTISN